MAKFIAFFKLIGSLIAGLFSSKQKSLVPEEDSMDKEEPKTEPVPELTLVRPVKHWRYISIYCIADLSDGEKEILTTRGDVIWSISSRSLRRLVMEGTGRLPNGKVVNVDRQINGVWRYKVMGPDSPHGVGIRSKALTPWVSAAHHLQQLRTHSMFGRTVIVPSLKGYEMPDGSIHDGRLEVHDTGGGLRKCPYFKGLWRTGDTKSEYGQFDLFIGGPETIYKKLLGTWNSYREVIVMPRDTETGKGIQETLNVLLDAGLKIDGIVGPKTKAAVGRLQSMVGLESTCEWDSNTKSAAEKSLNNWDESL